MTSAWTGHLVRLRAAEPEDWTAFAAYAEYTDDERNGWRLAPPVSAERTRRRMQELAETDPDLDVFELVIATLADNTPVGTVNTTSVEPEHGLFSYGVGVGRPHQRKGYAADAIVVLLRYMFGERRFQKCDVRVYGVNEGSQALHRRLGFVEEGRLRRSRYAGGRYDDILLFGITVEEFSARHGLAGPR
ncbi:GNAT family protein [Nonomuraea sp. NPDC050310]|uniref:GNAT family N-acetyltransferase n=1 Tax=unclassified Nonomuraea TaxID=2593643 RepID=UPI00340D8E86